jgi:PP-loop superfamily ATP-utilizing enzyme
MSKIPGKEEIVKSIKEKGFTIIHHCFLCGKKIDTFWNNKFQLDGNFMADGAGYSEIFDDFVPDPDKIICNKCFATKHW